ncbi:MAG: deoxyhypusine synthase [bacterium]
MEKKDFLKAEIEHFDIKVFDAGPLVDQYGKMAFQARNLARAARIYETMVNDRDCAIILCLAGSLFSAGLKRVVLDLVRANMVDVIVSTGAIIVDQDFFEGLGFRHYQGTPMIDDGQLLDLHIDRIYDTYIDEDQLRICDSTVRDIADALEPKAYSAREFVVEMGKWLSNHKQGEESVVRAAYEAHVPIFVPAFSDSSAGFGLVEHQYKRGDKPKVAIDSAKEFLELTKIKMASRESGLLMIGGGVPKNFAQDATVSAEILGAEVEMHKYAVQITVADERDGALSGSTLKEAHSWGKVDEGAEQMVFAEATLALPILASYAYHRADWRSRRPHEFNKLLED